MNLSYWPRLEPEIRRLAGTMTAHEMAKHLDVSYSSLITGASRRKISLAVPGLRERRNAMNPPKGKRNRKAQVYRLANALWKPTQIHLSAQDAPQ